MFLAVVRYPWGDCAVSPIAFETFKEAETYLAGWTDESLNREDDYLVGFAENRLGTYSIYKIG